MGIKNNVSVVLTIFSFSIFLFGLFYWDKLEVKNLYYLCFALAAYSLSIVVHITANSKKVKIASYAAMAVFGVNLLVEFAGKPTHWNDKDFGLIIIFALNMFIYGLIMEKRKSWKK